MMMATATQGPKGIPTTRMNMPRDITIIKDMMTATTTKGMQAPYPDFDGTNSTIGDY